MTSEPCLGELTTSEFVEAFQRACGENLDVTIIEFHGLVVTMTTAAGSFLTQTLTGWTQFSKHLQFGETRMDIHATSRSGPRAVLYGHRYMDPAADMVLTAIMAGYVRRDRERRARERRRILARTSIERR